MAQTSDKRLRDQIKEDQMNVLYKLLLLSLAFSTLGCTQMIAQRDYLTEMEHNNDRYFNPRGDFPVMAGDTGRTWESASERMGRTPASAEDLERQRSQRFLRDELSSLEGALSEDDFNFYEKHKEFLPSISERIYYLKLSRYERREYLSSKGADLNQRPAVRPYEESDGLRHSIINLGMSKNEVMNSWGRPARVEVAGNPSYENERWAYNVDGATKYIYFESGRVEGWE